MTAEITGLCRDHTFETAEEVCRRCGMEFCEMCVLYPKGAGKPLCKECAMIAGGVRNHASRPEMPKRDLKRKVKAFAEKRRIRVASPATRDAVEVSDPILQDPLTPAPMPPAAPAPAPIPAAELDDGAAVANELADVFNDPPPAPAPAAPPPAKDEPADGVAPPIDWSQPFG